MRAKPTKAVLLAALSGMLIAVTLPLGVFAINGVPAERAPDPSLRSRVQPPDQDRAPAPEIARVAALSTPSAVLGQITAAVPEAPGAADALAEADLLRDTGDLAGAARTYIELMARFPDTPQANAAGIRIEYLTERLSEAELDALEAGLPPREALADNSVRKALTTFFFDRADRLNDAAPARARDYRSRAMDLSWDILRDDLDDPYKSELVERYLAAADTLGQGGAARAELSRYAAGLEPCFTSWVIAALADGAERPMDYVPDFEGKVAIRKHYVRTGKAAADDASAAQSFRKARDVARRLLLDQPADQPVLYLAATYLRAATRIGERDSAAAELEGYLAEQPLSLLRWLVRSELAMDSVRAGRSEQETRAGFVHFERVIEEANSKDIAEALNDPAMNAEDRGIVVCMLGHAYLGTNRVDEARDYYEWVLDYYPRESHAGDSAAYSLIELEGRDVNLDPAEVAGDLEDFAAGNPSGAYSEGALLRAAGIYEAIMDLDAARAVYERIAQEYPVGAIAQDAAGALERLRAE